MKVLVVDDDQVMADVLSFTLRRAGYHVLLAADGAAALARWRDEKPDVILLDVNMPRVDGFEVCRQIRAESDIPIILLTVRAEEQDIIHGFNLGADDYLVKPFSPRQLIARLKAVLRRSTNLSPAEGLQAGSLKLVPARRGVEIDPHGKTIPLTRLEYRLLEHLMSHVGIALPFEALIDFLWGESAGDREMLRQLVCRLRRKIETNPSEPTLIQTIPGLGYGMLAGAGLGQDDRRVD